MKSVGTIAAVMIAMIALTASSAFASGNASLLGRGNAGIATTNEDATGIVNPAALSRMNSQPIEAGDDWFGQFGFTNDLGDTEDYWALQGAARKVGDTKGIGLGYAESWNDQFWYASYGDACSGKWDKWSWGATLANSEFANGPHEFNKVTANVGLLYMAPCNVFGSDATWSFGVVGQDVLDNVQTFVNAGLALEFNRFRLVADAIDVTDKVDTTFNFGGEYDVCKMLTIRAGSLDGDLTLGGTLQHGRIAVDYGYLDRDDTLPVLPASSSCYCSDYDLLTIRYMSSW